jgi:hypothetical protein
VSLLCILSLYLLFAPFHLFVFFSLFLPNFLQTSTASFNSCRAQIKMQMAGHSTVSLIVHSLPMSSLHLFSSLPLPPPLPLFFHSIDPIFCRPVQLLSILNVFANKDAVKIAGHSTASFIVHALIKAVAKFINQPDSQLIEPFNKLLEVCLPRLRWHSVLTTKEKKSRA